MKKLRLLYLLIFVIISISSLNAISNADLPERGHQALSLLNQFILEKRKPCLDHLGSPEADLKILKQFDVEDISIYSFIGLHPINDFGWFITIQKVADYFDRFHTEDNRSHVKIFCKSYGKYNLVLVKFNGFQSPESLKNSILLKYIGQEKDFNNYPWVLSLINFSNPVYYNNPHFLSPLQSVSELKNKRNGLIVINKGKMINFYNKGRLVCKNKQRELYNEIIYRIHEEEKKQKRQINSLEQIKKIILEEKNLLENHTLSNKEIEDFWGFQNPYNGVADSNDIGGGIYSFPEFYQAQYRCLNNKSTFNYLSRYHLVGITISIGIEGETSIAINLTTPQLRSWMFQTISDYYKNKK